eukprot:5819722-Prymnesium_polylepis.1
MSCLLHPRSSRTDPSLTSLTLTRSRERGRHYPPAGSRVKSEDRGGAFCENLRDETTAKYSPKSPPPGRCWYSSRCDRGGSRSAPIAEAHRTFLLC